MQIVFSSEVTFEQGVEFSGQTPLLTGLRAFVNGLPPRLPQIVAPPRFFILIGGRLSIALMHFFCAPVPFVSKHLYSIPPHSLRKISSHPFLHLGAKFPTYLVSTAISTIG